MKQKQASGKQLRWVGVESSREFGIPSLLPHKTSVGGKELSARARHWARALILDYFAIRKKAFSPLFSSQVLRKYVLVRERRGAWKLAHSGKEYLGRPLSLRSFPYLIATADAGTITNAN